MQAQFGRVFRLALVHIFIATGVLFAAPALAAPYAAMVMDARNGEVIFARNHDTRLHPASLTKMMTLYIAFEAVKHGEVTLDTMFTVSQRAASTTCVCLGLRAGQRISLRHLIRAAALRSANDASVVIAEGISGSVEAFAERMTRTARAMGMSNTTFKNPHGLTQTGHVSTARDMTILGRQLYFDYPQYYNIFSRRSDHAGVATVPNTNRRFLDAYQGADGIKTGYTRAAGFNLTASAKRGNRHIIATMFGGSSAAARNAHVGELLDIGFARAPARVAVRAPATPGYQGRQPGVAVAQAEGSGRTIRLQTAVRTSPRPVPRPDGSPDIPAPAEELLLALRDSVDAAVTQIAEASAAQAADAPEPEQGTLPELASVPPQPRPDDLVAEAREDADVVPDLEVARAAGFTIADPEDVVALSETASAQESLAADASAATESAIAALRPPPPPDDSLRADSTGVAAGDGTGQTEIPPDTVWIGAAESIMLAPADTAPDTAEPRARLSDIVAGVNDGLMFLNADLDFGSQPVSPAPPRQIVLTSAAQPVSFDEASAIASVTEARAPVTPEVVSRLSTSDAGRLWGVLLGSFNSRHAAERGLTTVKMAEAAALGNGISRIRQRSNLFEASVAGLTAAEAERACLRLQARSMDCDVIAP
ncbi:MAG: serine hydrolase [Rhodobacteraceae bacterium]|nr:serine hydrolase [Paracoccaceae bacterium]